ncbi:ABC transporter ATP-binding protein [Corynebacterium renale]|uniref:ABC transporter ATP-binding protein n=1 Tax=Corynebacterium renale TaxID=1724 RepID=UPI000E03B40B|nr:ABC transporter ATP-binding protein [Corynebacterium renale]STC98976.1 ABC transporter ATP-binding protein [Corynebacterium renale]
MVEGTGITFTRGSRTILEDVNITIKDGRTMGLVGPNGSGKTTLLRCLFGSLNPDSGQVLIDGTPLKDLDKKTLAHKLSVVTQEHESDMPVSIAELVMLGRLPYLGLTGRPTEEDEAIVEQSLRDVGAIHLATRDFSQLSGGEKQRSLIARGLTQQAQHILLDEPTNHLDIRFQYDIMDLIAHLPGAAVVVLHDLNLAARYCDDLMVFHDGKVVIEGPTSDVLVPEVLEPVYRLPVERIDTGDGFILTFRKADEEFLANLPEVRYHQHLSV